MKTPIEEQLAELRAGQRRTQRLAGGFVVAVLALVVVGAPMAMASGFLGGGGLASGGAASVLAPGATGTDLTLSGTLTTNGALVTMGAVTMNDNTARLAGNLATLWFSAAAGTTGRIASGISAANAGATAASSAFKMYPDSALDATDWVLSIGTTGNAASVFNVAYNGDVTSAGREAHTVQALTCAAGGGACALTITPSSSVITVDCQDADSCDVTMSETGAVAGSRVCIVIVGATGATDFADSAGVLEIAGAFAAGIADSICLVYANSAWHEISRSNN